MHDVAEHHQASLSDVGCLLGCDSDVERELLVHLYVLWPNFIQLSILIKHRVCKEAILCMLDHIILQADLINEIGIAFWSSDCKRGEHILCKQQVVRIVCLYILSLIDMVIEHLWVQGAEIACVTCSQIE